MLDGIAFNDLVILDELRLRGPGTTWREVSLFETCMVLGIDKISKRAQIKINWTCIPPPSVLLLCRSHQQEYFA